MFLKVGEGWRRQGGQIKSRKLERKSSTFPIWYAFGIHGSFDKNRSKIPLGVLATHVLNHKSHETHGFNKGLLQLGQKCLLKR